MTESVNVTTEATVLKTDKADVSVDLRPEDVTNLPLNQYRNYQVLDEPRPGRHAAAVPERADRHARPRADHEHQRDQPQQQRHADRRRRQHQRVAAASRRVHCPGRDHRERQHLDQQLRRGSGHDRWRRHGRGQTKSGTNTFKGSAFYFRQQDEFNARRGYFDPNKVDASTTITGGTVGGPVRRNRLFYFGSWERNLERQGIFNTYTVPTAKMRNGDFSEVLALNPNFRIYDPATGTSDGRNRTFFEGAVIPANRISDISKNIQKSYPAPNNAGTNNGLQNNLFIPRDPKADRDNYDVKVNWNRTSAHQIWGKFSMMQASVFDLFYLGLDGAGGGDTRTTVFTMGQTWTLSPTLLLDGSVGVNVMQQSMTGPDYGTNWGSDVWGIPGLNATSVFGPGSTDLQRYSGMPQIQTGLSDARQQQHVDAGVARRAQLHGLDQPDEGGRPSRAPHGLRLHAAAAQSLAAGSQQSARHPHVRRRRHRNARLYRRRRLERLRRVPARRDEQLQKSEQFEELSGRENQYGALRGGSVAGQPETHGEPRSPLRILPADVA